MSALRFIILLISGLCIVPAVPVKAQIPVADIIKAAIKKSNQGN